MTLEQEILIREAKARKEGREEGLAEGLVEGSIDTLVQLVVDGLISMSEGAKHADITFEEFQEEVAKKQHHSE